MSGFTIQELFKKVSQDPEVIAALERVQEIKIKAQEDLTYPADLIRALGEKHSQELGGQVLLSCAAYQNEEAICAYIQKNFGALGLGNQNKLVYPGNAQSADVLENLLQRCNDLDQQDRDYFKAIVERQREYNELFKQKFLLLAVKIKAKNLILQGIKVSKNTQPELFQAFAESVLKITADKAKQKKLIQEFKAEIQQWHQKYQETQASLSDLSGCSSCLVSRESPVGSVSAVESAPAHWIIGVIGMGVLEKLKEKDVSLYSQLQELPETLSVFFANSADVFPSQEQYQDLITAHRVALNNLVRLLPKSRGRTKDGFEAYCRARVAVQPSSPSSVSVRLSPWSSGSIASSVPEGSSSVSPATVSSRALTPLQVLQVTAERVVDVSDQLTPRSSLVGVPRGQSSVSSRRASQVQSPCDSTDQPEQKNIGDQKVADLIQIAGLFKNQELVNLEKYQSLKKRRDPCLHAIFYPCKKTNALKCADALKKYFDLKNQPGSDGKKLDQAKNTAVALFKKVYLRSAVSSNQEFDSIVDGW